MLFFRPEREGMVTVAFNAQISNSNRIYGKLF